MAVATVLLAHPNHFLPIMKKLKPIAILAAILSSNALAQDPPAEPAATEGPSIKIEAHGIRDTPPPLFFSASANALRSSRCLLNISRPTSRTSSAASSASAFVSFCY